MRTVGSNVVLAMQVAILGYNHRHCELIEVQVSHNPYTPPTSEVQDVVASTEAVADGNRDVVRSCVLIWCAYGLSLVNVARLFVRFSALESPVFVILAISITIGLGIACLIAWWMTSKLRAGRNWMRILVVVITGIFLVYRVVFFQTHSEQVIQLYSRDKLLLMVAGAQLAVWLIAIGLLFTTRSRNWFEEMKRARY